MTDEEMAEGYKESRRHKCFSTDVRKVQIEYEAYLDNLKQAFLAGLKAGEAKAKKEIEEALLRCYQGYMEEQE